MAGLVLGETPAGGLLRAVMAAAEWSEVAFAGATTLVIGDGVVEVAVDGGAAATGGSAGALTHDDEVAQR